jgi:hypothetical protein
MYQYLRTSIYISLRVNVDMAKSAFSYFMMRDDEIAGTIGTQFTCFTSTKVQKLTQKALLVRSSLIPEELGRIDYLLYDTQFTHFTSTKVQILTRWHC